MRGDGSQSLSEGLGFSSYVDESPTEKKEGCKDIYIGNIFGGIGKFFSIF